MATYRIYFFGLILHIGAEKARTHSGVIWDSVHEPVLMFGPNDELKLENISSIEIDGLPRSAAVEQATFTQYVPSAKDIMGGNLETAAGSGTGRGATYFHHVGGQLYAADLYPHRSRHLRNNVEVRRECVASLTLLLLETEERLTVKAGPLSRALPPESCLLIANLDIPDGHDSRTRPHLRKYSKLTNFSDTDITIEEEEEVDCPSVQVPAQPCSWIEQVIRSPRGLTTSAHSECGNNTWP